MSNGKFSNPRPHRDEERQIEETFRQLTGQAPVRKSPVQEFDIPADDPFPLTGNDPFVPPVEEAFQRSPEDLFAETFEMPKPQNPYGAYERRTSPPKGDPFDISFAEELFAEEPEPPEEDALDKFLAFIRENKKLVLGFVFAAALLLMVVVGSIFLKGSINTGDETILNNVYIAQIHVGGLTKKEAITLLKQATDQTYSVLPMTIDLAGQEILLSPKDTGVRLDTKAAVEAAYAYGRTGSKSQQEQDQLSLRLQPHTIALLSYLELDEDYIRSTLRSYAEDAGSTLTQTSYGLEGTQPELSVEKFVETAPTQTLVITMGTPGIGFDYHDVYDQVMDAYSLNQFKVTVEDVESAKEPEPINLVTIYEEFFIAPVDDRMDMQTFETIHGSYGYEFDLETAQKLVDQAGFGDVIRIPMEYIEPKLLGDDMLFRDVLGEVTLNHSSDSARNTNLSLACQAINGTVVNPGEQFSFNDKVGNRSSANGYKDAFEVIREISNEEEDPITGGGVSQVASALYESALLSDLQIDYRVNQDLAPGYSKDGLDAYVDWRSPDLQFTNTTGYPVQISASASKGNVTVQILGTDERSYYIKLETSVTSTDKPGTEYWDYDYDNQEGFEDGDVIREGIEGFTVKVYKCKYDKSSGTLLSRDFEATSQYETVDTIIARVEPEPTEAPTRPVWPDWPPEPDYDETFPPEYTEPEFGYVPDEDWEDQPGLVG